MKSEIFKIGEVVTVYCATMPVKTGTLLRSIPNSQPPTKGVGFVQSQHTNLIYAISLKTGVCLNHPHYAIFPRKDI